jgi:cytochrome c oxidase assembly protein subunit 15
MPLPLSYNTVGLTPQYRRAQFWCAVAVAISVFPLIWMGGLVTTYGVGMSVPDWPNSYGYNMFLYPPSRWVGGIFYEHTHRLLGTLSGFLSVALVAFAWAPSRIRRLRSYIGNFTLGMFALMSLSLAIKAYLIQSGQADYEFRKGFSHIYVFFGSLGLFGLLFWLGRHRDERRWVRWLTIIQLVAIIIQGTLGGLRVTEVNTTLAIIHGCFAHAFFCATAFTALVMSKWWIQSDQTFRTIDARSARVALYLSAFTVILIFGQLIAGALMRHNGAGLAIPDLPLSYGRLLPPIDETGLDAANAMRVWDPYHLPPTTLTAIWMHYSHRVGAVLVSLSIIILAFQVFRNLRQSPPITILVTLICLMLVGQFTLGVLTVYLQKPADITSLHVAIGALTAMVAGLATAVIGRQYALHGTRLSAVSRDTLSQQPGYVVTA